MNCLEGDRILTSEGIAGTFSKLRRAFINVSMDHCETPCQVILEEKVLEDRCLFVGIDSKTGRDDPFLVALKPGTNSFVRYFHSIPTIQL